MKTLALLLLSGCLGLAPLSATAETIPSGTTLVLKTTSSITSGDNKGKPIQGRLSQNVEVKGKVVLAEGTAVAGVVESPRVAIASSTRPLTLRLTEVSVGGKMIPIKTESLETDAAGVKTRGGKRVTGGAFVLSPGTTLQFKLSQPLNL